MTLKSTPGKSHEKIEAILNLYLLNLVFGRIMIVMATIGVLVNAIMACVLSCSHKHHAHVDEARKTRGSVFIPPRIIDSKCSFASHGSSSISSNIGRRGDEKSVGHSALKQGPPTDDKCEHVNMLISRNINIRAAFIHIIGTMIVTN